MEIIRDEIVDGCAKDDVGNRVIEDVVICNDRK
jgi:hypothetical protein